MEPKIIFEDNSFLVIDKPSGMIVNRADTTQNIVTVQDWAEKHISFENVDEASEFYKRGGIVHRLDKETSGLLLIAKTLKAFESLQKQFKERIVKKKYLALVHGKVFPEEGEINAPVGRLPWSREKFGVMPGGKEAMSKYKIVKYYKEKEFTLIEVYPQTGRTHQIRIHMKYLGFPLVGDSLYAGRKQALNDRKFCPRVFLHASSINFNHPQTGETLKLESSLPDDLNSVLSYIEK